jgi:CRP/FNR family transcriptional regulator
MLEAIRNMAPNSADARVNALLSAESLSNHTLPAGSKCVSVVTAGWQRQGDLWSDLNMLCGLLSIPECIDLNSSLPLFQHRRYKRGQRIHTIGQQFDTLFAVHSGFLKTILIDNYDNEQVLAFPMKGDLFGVDGVLTRRHTAEAVAQTDCDLVLIPFRELSMLARTHAGMETLIYTLLGRELQREQAMISVLCSLSAEAKVAHFLVSLSDRFVAMGYSGKLFNLRMSRQDIGSYLGLTLETVSRTLSALNACGLISVQRRAIGLIEIDALRNLHRLPSHALRAEPAAPVRSPFAA